MQGSSPALVDVSLAGRDMDHPFSYHGWLSSTVMNVSVEGTDFGNDSGPNEVKVLALHSFGDDKASIPSD